VAIDAVVIGTGPNGLVAANLLADAGWDVVALEAAPAPGGGVRTAEITAPGFQSDLCSAFYPLTGGPAPISLLGLEDYGLTWRHAPHVLTHVLPDGRTASLYRDPEATAASVAQFAPDDGERWLRAYAQWRSAGTELIEALFAPFPPVRGAARLLRRTGAGGGLRLARRFVLSARLLAEELFTGEGAQLLLAGSALHTDLTPAEAASGGYGWLLAMLGQEYGFPVPAGGAGALTAALVARLRARGGEIVCDARVDRIHVDKGRAIGVTTVDGRRWPAGKAVLADVSAPALYLHLLDRSAVPERLREDLTHFRFDSSTVKVDWAVSTPVPWRAAEARGAGTVHLGGDLRALARYAASLAADEVPDETFTICGQMTTSDSSRSPDGTESLWAYTHLPWRRHWPEDAVEDVVKRMEMQLEQHAPGFGRSVVGRHVTGPAEFEAENANLVGGSIGGGTSGIHQQLFLRPVPGLGRADTVVDGLYLASASAHPGGGVHGGPGANAARAAIARARPVLGSIYGSGIRFAHRRLYR
jgi:phytoene dehydrogenase-like protein